MSKKKANVSSVNSDSVRVINQKEFQKLQIHFRNTKADRNFLSVIGSMLMWILAIPILLTTFYILSVSILSMLEYFELLGDTFTPEDGILVSYLIEPFEASFVHLLNVLNVNTETLGELTTDLEPFYKSEGYILLLTIGFLITSLLATLFYGWIFVEEFSVMTGKSKNRKKAIWFNIFFVAPSLIFVTFLLFGMAQTETFLFEGTSIITSGSELEQFKDWMKYAGIAAVGVAIVPTIILLLGKYKTSIYLKIES